MASMLLGKAREEKLKEQAFQELNKMVPALKQLIGDCVTSKDFCVSLQHTALLAKQSLTQLTDQLWSSITAPMVLVGCFTGLLIGLAEMAVFAVLCP